MEGGFDISTGPNLACPNNYFQMEKGIVIKKDI
jgi:hypothetical protein